MRVMNRIQIVTLMLCALPVSGVSALERIKKAPPTRAEAERIASEQAMNDTTLQKGDIVSTAQGFFVYRGTNVDGQAGGFARISNPFLERWK